jgi:hypothetical protein
VAAGRHAARVRYCGGPVARWGVGVAAPRGRVGVEHWSLASGRGGCWLATGEVGGWRGGEGSGRGGWRGGQVAREAAGGWRLRVRVLANCAAGQRECGLRPCGADCGLRLRTAICGVLYCCAPVNMYKGFRVSSCVRTAEVWAVWPFGRWRAPRCRVNYIGLPGSGSRAVNGSDWVVLGFLGRTGQPSG